MDREELTQLEQELAAWRNETRYLHDVIRHKNNKIARHKQDVSDTQYQLDYAQQQVKEYVARVKEAKEAFARNDELVL